MKLEDFFRLPEEEQSKIVKIFKIRESIIRQRTDIKHNIENFYQELRDLQERCPHPLLEVNKVWDCDEYGRMQSFGHVTHSCPDCEKRWHEEFNE